MKMREAIAFFNGLKCQAPENLAKVKRLNIHATKSPLSSIRDPKNVSKLNLTNFNQSPLYTYS